MFQNPGRTPRDGCCDQTRHQVIERVGWSPRCVAPISRKHLEQGHEDGHLQKHGQAAGQRVELRLGVELLHLLLLPHADRRHTCVWISCMRGCTFCIWKRRLRLLVHQRRDEDAEDDRDDDDGQAPVAAEVVEELDDRGISRSLNDVPHVACIPSLYTKESRTILPILRDGIVSVRASRTASHESASAVSYEPLPEPVAPKRNESRIPEQVGVKRQHEGNKRRDGRAVERDHKHRQSCRAGAL